MADPPNMEFTAEVLDKLKTYAAHLPYSIEPNSDMQNLLDFYLTRITQCVEAKDYDPGFLQWDSMLNYFHLLKYPIPKPKRIALARVYFDLCVTPGMPLHVVNTCLDTLNSLLRSKKKMSVDDLRLPWKPIYHVLSKDLFLSRRQFEISQTSNQMAQLAELTRRFFHPACADEMVDTILPSFNGLDLNSVLATQYYLNTFLPLSHPTWLPMLMRIWSAVNSYMFDERHFALLAQLAEIHLDPAISDPRRIDEIPDDARLDENGLPEDSPRLRWSTGDAQNPSSSARGDDTPRQKMRRQTLGINGINGLGLANGAYGNPSTSQPSKLWTGIFKDIGIFTQEEWDLIMCKCLASMEIPLADAGSFMTGPVVDEEASFEFSRLPKSNWRIYSLAKLIVYSMAPDGKQLPHSGTATPFEIPVAGGGGYFNIPLPKAEKSYLAGCKALDSLAKLIVSLESFFHPSNGSYTTDLSAFLKYIVFEFSKRWHHETLPDCKVPMNRRLTSEIRRELVRCLRTPCLLAMFSGDSDTVSNIQSALKSMTIMEADLIVPAILERAIPSLEALVETQRTLAVIKALGAVALGIVSRDVYYGGAKHLVQVLELLLPGIDANDPLKTVCTTAFLVEVSQHIQFSDLTEVELAAVSSDTKDASWSPVISKAELLPTVRFDILPSPSEETDSRLSNEEEDRLLRDSTAGFANWVTGFIRRVIVLLENLPDETAPGSSNGGGTESTVVSAAMEACSQICSHLSEPLFDLVLDLVWNFATTTVRANAVRAVHQLVECVARANSSKTLKRFLPYAIRNIRSELDHGASSVRTTTYSHIEPSDATLHWNIAILRGSLYHGGRAVLEYKDDLSSVIDVLHRKTFSKRGFSYTGKLLYSLLDTLTQIYTLEDRFVNPDEWDSASFRSGHHRYWGRLYAAEDVEIQWHIPSSDEVVFVLELLTLHIEPTLSTLESLISDTATRNEAWENDFCRHLSFVRNAFAALPTIRQEFMSENEILESCGSSDVLNELPEFIASVKPVKSGFVFDSPSDPRYTLVSGLRDRFARFLHSASEKLVDEGDENTVDAILMLIRSCRTYFLDYGDSRYSHQSQESDYLSELGVTRRYANQKVWPRAIFVRRAQLYHAARLRWNALERRRGKLEDSLIDDLLKWSTWSYATVRASAQSLVEALTSAYDGIRKRSLGQLYPHLEKGSDDDRMKGALYTLNLSNFCKFAMGEPTLVYDLTKYTFGCQWNEKPSIQNCVSSIADQCVSGFVEPSFVVYKVQYPPTEENIARLRDLLPSNMADSALVKRCAVNRSKRHAMQESAMVDVRDLLLRIAEDPRTHWKYSITAIRLLRTLIRRDSPLHASHVEYLLTQTHADHPSMRYYAQRAVMKASRYIKLRTSTGSPEDIAFYRNHNPLRRTFLTPQPSHEYTAEYLESFKGPLDRAVAREEPVLQDKLWSGWLVWKYQSRFLIADSTKSTFQPWDPVSTPAIEVIKRLARSTSFWDKLSTHFSEENYHETTVMDNVANVKSLVQLMEEDIFPVLRQVIEKLISDKDQNKQRGAAELLAGLLGGSKHWPTDAQDRLWAWFTPILDQVLGTNVKTDTLTIWSSFLEYVLSNKDPRRVQPLVDWLVKKGLSVDFNSESSFEPIKMTFFIRTMIEALGWRFAPWAPAFLKVYWSQIGCEHDEVTSYIAEALMSFCKISWRPTPSQPIAEVFVRECATWPSDDDIMGLEHGYHLDALLNLVAEFPEMRENRLPGALAPRSPYDRKLMTIIRWLFTGLQEVNASSMFQYIIPMLPELFKAAELQDHDALARRSQTLLTALCGVTPPLPKLPNLLDVIFVTIRKSPSWRIRSNTLPMLQILYFRQAPIISEEMVVRIQDVLSECLSDEVVEVRERAAITLSGILRCSPRRTILLLKDRFVREASRITLPSRNTPKYASALRRLHAAVLGVTALIDAFPYSVPSWLPELIGDVLSRHTYDPIPISTTVRKCATKFKETHQDTWHEDSLKFDEEQMSALATLLAGSSYYA